MTTSDIDCYLELINSLPLGSTAGEWLGAFREALGRFVGDADRISINLNMYHRLFTPEQESLAAMITELTGRNRYGGQRNNHTWNEKDPAVDIVNWFREKGLPVDDYHPPYAVNYHDPDGEYIGTLLLFKLKSRAPLSAESKRRLEQIAPFVRFLLTDCIARDRAGRSHDGVFYTMFQKVVNDGELTASEQKVLILRLDGGTTRDAADRLRISARTVQTHLRNIYRKLGVRTLTELSARYFVPAIPPLY